MSLSRTLSLRPVGPGDDVLLRAIFENVRAAEFAGMPVSPEQKASFFDQQFSLQSRFYREHFPDAAHDILLLDGQPAGRLYVNRSKEEIVIADLALLPDYWTSGLLIELLAGILNEARSTGCRVTASIEQSSPELAIYESLGFRRVGAEFVNFSLEWSASADADAPESSVPVSL